MKYFLIPYLILVISYAVPAHPGIGIVKDSKGNIYYTDLEKVWKITIDGKRTVVVRSVHTHELYIDANDDLYGEHLWYNGEALNTWGHYVWCLRHTGKLDTVISPTAGFLNDYSFVRDGVGNMYWVQKFTVSKFKKRTKDGQVITIAEGKFKNIRWMHAAKNGTIYFVDLTDLYKLENGKFTLLKKDLHERTSVFEYASLDHNVYGIWLDENENIYVAVMGGQVVKKITTAGIVTNVVYSHGLWKPCGGLFDDEGALWLMETNTIAEVRVRKIEKKNIDQSISILEKLCRKTTPLLLIALFFAILFIPVLYIGRKFLRKRNEKIKTLVV